LEDAPGARAKKIAVDAMRPAHQTNKPARVEFTPQCLNADEAGPAFGWRRPLPVDFGRTLDEVAAAHYDAVVLPGGQINPDLLRVEPKALKFIKDIFDAKKVVAAVCHAPWLLIETGIAKGRKMTSFKSIKTDVANAGGKWEDSEVVVDQGVITSRNPGDLEAFSAKIIEEIKEGRHDQRSAA
jgi:protease I